MSNWTPTSQAVPPRGTEVDTISSGGQASRLVFRDGLWWLPDFSMYVYYVPEFWRLP